MQSTFHVVIAEESGGSRVAGPKKLSLADLAGEPGPVAVKCFTFNCKAGLALAGRGRTVVEVNQ